MRHNCVPQKIKQVARKEKDDIISITQKTMNVVGINVLKREIKMRALRPTSEVAPLPKKYAHAKDGLELIALVIEDTHVVMNTTSRSYKAGSDYSVEQ